MMDASDSPTSDTTAETPDVRLSRADLRDIAFEYREQFHILHNCWHVNKAIRNRLSCEIETAAPDYPEMYVDVVWVAVTDRQQDDMQGEHYVVALDSAFVTDDVATDGCLLVDAALEQFNDQNEAAGDVPFSLGRRDDIDDVVIAPLSDDRRYEIYHNGLATDADTPVRFDLPL